MAVVQLGGLCSSCGPSLSVELPPISAYYSSAVLDGRRAASDIWPIAVTKYCALAVRHFLVLVSDGAFGWQSAGSGFQLSCHGIFDFVLTRM